jgi:hypothetical protein
MRRWRVSGGVTSLVKDATSGSVGSHESADDVH